MSLLDGLHLLQQGQWDAAHRIAQADESDLGSWLHGIVHMAEPDEWNSRYWYRAAGRSFPGMDALGEEMTAFEEVELTVEQDHLIVRPVRHARAGWDERFGAMAAAGDDHLLDAKNPSMTQWDAEEWEW